MKKTWLPASLIVLCFALTGCNNNPIAPEPLEPGSRNYTWKLDTLDMAMNSIRSIWGASPNDVWVTGGGWTEQANLLNYDGTNWLTYKNEPIWFSPFTLFGFSADNIWMGGSAEWFGRGARIWHYDGVQWSQNYIYDVKAHFIIRVIDIWGTSPNHVYACGYIIFCDGINATYRGFVLHFDGKNWEEVVRAQVDSQFLTIRKEQDRVYIQSLNPDKKAMIFYQLKNRKLKEIFSVNLDKVSWASHNIINGNVYFAIGQNVYRYLNGEIIKQFSIPYSDFECQIWGRHELDLFLPMKDGLVHYNGRDMKYIYKFPSKGMKFIGPPIIFEKDLFICAEYKGGQRYNLVLHGWLP
ncbi:MAG: hypothetical protein ONB27_12120 [candidate division KSB1 bacterium]|nr:hypothetical protein [candidate division KSB1 bacterium]